jgi:hypothetical protein
MLQLLMQHLAPSSTSPLCRATHNQRLAARAALNHLLLMHTSNNTSSSTSHNKFKRARYAAAAAATAATPDPAAPGSSNGTAHPHDQQQHQQQQQQQSTTATATPASPKVIIITGPTAVGKTKLGLELAKRLGGEIISADSVQVYRGLDVGSDKVRAAAVQLLRLAAATAATASAAVAAAGGLIRRPYMRTLAL